MASKGENTSFRQFIYCSLCKYSHKRGKKHIYSKRHQLILKAIIQKFSSKIQQAKKDLFNPIVKDMTFEADAKFWCYFCQEQFAKHDKVENYTVVGAGLLEHVSSKDHKAGMEQFFWDNLMKKELKPLFVLSPEDLYIFKKAAFLAVKKRQKSEELARKKIAEKISLQEMKRLSDSAIKATSLEDLPGSTHSGTSLVRRGTSATGSGVVDWQEARYQSQQTVSARKMTVSAKAYGLSYIKPATQGDTGDGNVHSGGIPPWLQSEVDGSETSVIGPTLKDFQKHLELEKKAKLPANRVGASFDHTATTSHDWLPSFGRVWSKGRRLQSKQHFERELKIGQKFEKRKQNPTSTISSYTASCSNLSVKNQDSGNPRSQNLSQHKGYYDVDIATEKTPVVPTNFQTPVACNPYKRKRDSSRDQTANQNQAYINAPTTNHTVPYKRQREQSYNNTVQIANQNQAYINVPTTNHTVPYKRQREQSYNNTVQIANQNQAYIDAPTTNHTVPYRRQREQSYNKTVGQMRLLHTPVLALDEQK